MDSGTISDIRNITITKSWLNRKRDRKRQNLFDQNSFVIISSSPKIRKSPIVKISREDDFRVAQFVTYRPIWQPCVQIPPNSFHTDKPIDKKCCLYFILYRNYKRSGIISYSLVVTLGLPDPDPQENIHCGNTAQP